MSRICLRGEVFQLNLLLLLCNCIRIRPHFLIRYSMEGGIEEGGCYSKLRFLLVLRRIISLAKEYCNKVREPSTIIMIFSFILC